MKRNFFATRYGRRTQVIGALVIVSAGVLLGVAGCAIGLPLPGPPLPTVSLPTLPLPTSPLPTLSLPTLPIGVIDVPGPDNTGWQHTGVQLQQVACVNDEYLIDKPGTVVDGKFIPCSVRVAANNVTITRSKITATANNGIYKLDQFRSLAVSDTEIVGTPACGNGIGYTDVHVHRVNIHGCEDGVHAEEGSTVEDSWLHDLRYDRGPDGLEPHNDGVQSTGSSNLVIRHNRIDNAKHQTSCILIGGEAGAPSNILIENNYLNGGNYTIYLDPKGSNRVIRNNTFTRAFVYGPDSAGGQFEWYGNHFDDGSQVDG